MKKKTDKLIPLIMTWATRMREHDKGNAARMRRSSSIEETLLTEGFMFLRQDLKREGIYVSDLENLAVAATIAIRIKPSQVQEPFGKQLWGEDSQHPKFSKLRFQRLMTSDTNEELLNNMKNAVDILNKTVNTYDVLKTILEWEIVPNTKNKLAEKYYGL